MHHRQSQDPQGVWGQRAHNRQSQALLVKMGETVSMVSQGHKDQQETKVLRETQDKQQTRARQEPQDHQELVKLEILAQQETQVQPAQRPQ